MNPEMPNDWAHQKCNKTSSHFNIFSFLTVSHFVFCLQLILKPNHFAVYKVKLTAPSNAGNYLVDIRVATNFDVSTYYCENVT